VSKDIVLQQYGLSQLWYTTSNELIVIALSYFTCRQILQNEKEGDTEPIIDIE
jgi:hypothetical protein